MKKPGRKGFLPNDADRALAAEMKRRRIEKKLSQEHLARRIGLSAATINRYENLRRGPTAQDLAAIESIIGPCRPSSATEDSSTMVREVPAPYGRVSDPDRKVEGEPNDGGYTVEFSETEYIARELDAIKDKTVRVRAMKACADAITEALHPQMPVARKSGSRARHS